MATKIVTKNSSTAASVPTAAQLVQGELAVNVADKRLYTEDNAGAIVELGTNPSTIDINAGTIDGTVIGGTTAASGTFTAFTSTGIDDNATSTAITIDSSENVGIGTSSPSRTLSVAGAFGVQSTANDGAILMIPLGTENRIYSRAGDGSTTALPLTFRMGDTERMRIDSSGNLLVGTTTLADVNNIITNHLFEGANSTAGSAAVGVYNNAGTANCPAFNVLNRDASTDTTNRFVQFYANVTSSGATAMGGIVGNGASNVQFAALSDAREKQNIKAITNSLDKITSLNPVKFDWITSGEHCKAGFIAQEVEEVFPEFVVENMSSEGQEERKGLTGGMTGGIVAHLVKAIQEQQTLIESLTTRIAALEE